ncbi:MAG: hypothetical protein ACOYT8_06170 [Candidatus Dependentiae bacterium]
MKLLYFLVILGSLANISIFTMEKNQPSIQDLPSEIRYGEIIKQIINTAQSRLEAKKSIESYRLTSKEAANYIAQHADSINKILDHKFAASLNELASGNFNNARIKNYAIEVLLNGIIDPETGKEIPSWYVTHSKERQEIANILDAEKISKKDLLAYYTFNKIIDLIKFGLDQQNYQISAVALGILKYLSTEPNYTQYKKKIVDHLTSAGKTLISRFAGIPFTGEAFQLFDLIINYGLILEGSDFITTGLWSGSLLKTARLSNNQQIITYLENKLKKS